jgi:hypothetical protein
MSEPSPAPIGDDLDKAVDEALQSCGGDAGRAIRGLIAAQRIIEAQVSTGYVRRRLQ